MGNTQPREEDFSRPCWNNQETIDEFLEKGRLKQKQNSINALSINIQRIRTGKVTKSTMDYLVIDHEYQFSKRSLLSSEQHDAVEVNVGDTVTYTLDGDKCVNVMRGTPFDNEDEFWGEESDQKKRSKRQDVVSLSKTEQTENMLSLNGKIVDSRRTPSTGLEFLVEIQREKAKLETVSVPLGSVAVGGPVSRSSKDSVPAFVPQRGDWIRLTILPDQEDHGLGKVVALEPLRWNNFEGEITRIGKMRQSDFAIVEGEVFIDVGNACINGYRPLRGEWVGGLAFESAAPEGCSWRAINVYPRPQSLFKPRVLSCSSNSASNNASNSTKNDPDSDELKHLEINGDVHFGQILLEESKTELISITNNGDCAESLLLVKFGESVSSSSSEKSAFRLDKIELPARIEPKQRLDLTVICQPKQVGLENTRIRFFFGDTSKISTYVEVEGVTPELLGFTPVPASGLLLSKNNNNRISNTAVNSFRGDNAFVVPGERPVFSSKPREVFIQRLGSYELPEKLRRCLEQRDDVVTICPYLVDKLSLENYMKRFQALLHMEEFAIQKELDLYSLSRVFFHPVSTTYLALKVPGLQEQRPSLLVGDKVIAKDPSPNSNSPAYEGYICEVRTEDVLLMFSSAFHSGYNGEDYNVSFKFNRTPFRRSHQAVEIAMQRLGQKVLFPQPEFIDGAFLKEAQTRVALRDHRAPSMTRGVRVDPGRYVPRLELAFFNPNLNERQRQAVVRIVEGLARPIPYVIYGPPGTGKTMTLVEVLLQLYDKLPGARILACAPSNSAADLLLVRLHQLNEHSRGGALDMVRLNAAQRKDGGMEDEVIQRYSKSLDDIDVAVKCRLVVATCTTAGQMYTANVKVGSFTHVAIDEAGHATEPEVLVPLNFVDVRNGQVVLAGDPQQLGPILESRLSNVYGLQVSLLERLSQLPVYGRDETRFSRIGVAGNYNPLVATKLVNNYRSHPALFAVSSRLFYDNDLVPNAPIEVQTLFVEATKERPGIDFLPNPEIPLVLHAIQGRDLREGDSMSWFNCHEIMIVISYLRKLLFDGFNGVVTPDDIGIITPYRKQIEKIRMFMERASLPRVKVGTVEEFQGQERTVIILSLVRSTETTNVRQALGFLANPKRMNVALTRAKSLLIVVANPFVMMADPYWADLLRFCLENRCCVGTDDVLARIEQRLENVPEN